MIYDKRAELARYFGLSPNLDAAIRFLQTTDLTALPMGRTEIPGGDIYYNHFPSPARTTYSASSQSDVLAGRTAHVEARAPPFFQKITCQSTGALGGGVALVIVTGIERRDHTLIFLISIQFSLMSAGNFQDQLVNIHRNSIGELWQVPLTGKDQQESVLVQRNRIFRRTQVHGRILICTNFRLI